MDQLRWNQMYFIMANGKMDKDMEEVSKFGLMVQFMKDIGSKIKLVEMED